jgi:signal transduction histidine kinase/ActR/RegA family two-component response regulator
VDAIVASSRASSRLEDALAFVCRAVEAQTADTICSILILDPSGRFLSHGAAPNLPQAYVQAINGLAIGPKTGSCGTASFLGKPVIVSDIARDPLWDDYRHLALPHGLRACWSIPIISSEGKVLGTFALYYRESRPPSDQERKIVQWATPLAAMVIEEKMFLDQIAENVTEKRNLEAQLLQAQKMEALGRMAGGIAHDFNNLLTIMQGHLDLLREELGPQHPGVRRAKQVSAAADSAAALTRQLLAFSRMQILQPSVISLNAVVKEMGKLLRPLISGKIDLSIELDPNPGHAMADRVQIEQVILNLVVNARDAMTAGGRLVIKTANIEVDEAWANLYPPTAAGSYVMLSVSDTGTGMDAETLAHIFEPFFTTKGQGKGTGLGLAMVYGIVKQSSGYIWVKTELGQGTSFQVYLPRTKAHAGTKAPTLGQGCPGGDETILLIEDEDGVRQIVSEMLEQCGYRVLPAKNGADAIEVSSQYPETIHLILTDLVMSGVDGFEVAARLTRLRPGIEVIYISGFNAMSEVQRRKLGSAIVLQKPFARDTLARAVREAIDRSAGMSSRAAGM